MPVQQSPQAFHFDGLEPLDAGTPEGVELDVLQAPLVEQGE